jgi:hypothetical protein
MGDVPAGHISKGIIHARVDALVNHKDANGAFDKRAAFRAELTNATTADKYIELLKTQAGVLKEQADYLNAYFYKPGVRWWETIQPIFPILHQGLIKALEEAGNTLLLDSYWMPVAGSEVVEVIICKSSTQVTRIFLTPPPGVGPSTPRTKPAPMWVVKKTDPNQQLQAGISKTKDAVVEAADGEVATWRIQDFSDSAPGMTGV